MKKNTSKIENKGISVLRNLIDNMDCVTHSFEENNTEISWDGDIKLYKNPDVDDKGNLSSIIRVQVKSRTRKIPSGELDNPDIFKSELEIYTKILNFIKAHHIDKDINLDKWTWDEINKFVIWIRAIDEGIPIRVENFKTSVLFVYER